MMDLRRAMWEAIALTDRAVRLFMGHQSQSAFEQPGLASKANPAEHVVQEYPYTSLRLKRTL
jgi:hypothetical protein